MKGVILKNEFCDSIEIGDGGVIGGIGQDSRNVSDTYGFRSENV